MRDIKFKAIVNGEIVNVVRITFARKVAYIVSDKDEHGHEFQINKEELLQYTGLKDKKRTKEYPEGQEIYEGDLCKVSTNNKTWVVVFRAAEYGISRNCSDGATSHASLFGHNHSGGLEVIGNIYENPELMEQ